MSSLSQNLFQGISIYVPSQQVAVKQQTQALGANVVSDIESSDFAFVNLSSDSEVYEAVLAGKSIVNEAWLDSCTKAGKVIQEPYILSLVPWLPRAVAFYAAKCF